MTPKLVLIYPYSEHFTQMLPEFVYENIDSGLGMKLWAFPFNLTDSTKYQQQVQEIIEFVSQ